MSCAHKVTYYFRGTEGRKDGGTEGQKSKNYVPPLFFEKAGDNKVAVSGGNIS